MAKQQPLISVTSELLAEYATTRQQSPTNAGNQTDAPARLAGRMMSKGALAIIYFWKMKTQNMRIVFAKKDQTQQLFTEKTNTP